MTHSVRRTNGFTIVELIIIVAVIGILAAITIVSYSAVTENTKRQAVMTDAQTAAAYLNKYKAENGSYPASLDDVESFPQVQSEYQYAFNPTTGTYCVTASVEGSSAFVVSGNSQAQQGGCAGHGVDGVAGITNFVPNPALRTGTTGWATGAAGATGTSSRVASGGPSGVVASFYRFATTATATGSPITITTTAGGVNAIPVESSTEYTLTAYVRSSCDTSAGIRMDFNTYSSTGATLPTSGGPTFRQTPNTWHLLTRTFTTAADNGFIRPFFSYSGPTVCPAVSTFDATAVMLTKGGTEYPYADGESPNWIWNGAANNSSSTGPPTYNTTKYKIHRYDI